MISGQCDRCPVIVPPAALHRVPASSEEERARYAYLCDDCFALWDGRPVPRKEYSMPRPTALHTHEKDVDLQARIGRRIQYWRTQRELTQAALAQLVGLSPSGVASIEIGRSIPTLKTVYALARALDVGLTDLLPDLELAQGQEAFKPHLLRPDEAQDLIRLAGALQHRLTSGPKSDNEDYQHGVLSQG